LGVQWEGERNGGSGNNNRILSPMRICLRVLLYMDGDMLMIFNVQGHIEMIRNGLWYRILYNETEPRILKGIIKTQTRRPNRSTY